MHKFLYLSFASALIFGLGVVSGNLGRHQKADRLTEPQNSVAAEEQFIDSSVVDADCQSCALKSPDVASLPAAVIQPPGTAPEQVTALLDTGSVSDFGLVPAGHQLPAIETDIPVHAAALSSEAPAATTPRAEAIIREYFPEIERPVLTGWMDAYSGLTEEDLHGVMQQRTLLTGDLPQLDLPELDLPPLPMVDQTQLTPPLLELADREFLSLPDHTPAPLLPQPLDAGDLPPLIPVTDRTCAPIMTPEQQIIRTAQDNLRQVVTVGFRRTIVRTQVATVSPEASHQEAVVFRQFDLNEGQFQPSPDPLHVAIAGGGNCMFVLEPGNIVTRNGQFQLSEDGQVGLSGPSGFLTVKGTSSVPAGATGVHFAQDGSLEYTDLEGTQRTAGAAALVRVDSPAALSSANGVYFRLSGDNVEPVTPEAEQPLLHVQTVELSNVLTDQERALIDHFQQLSAAGVH
ncbi:MAG: hypothetical protein NXI04_10735 [Planctomycetaceae bacterium]|nr:hypothetical protein [Planctomycetaceae bacterium]